MKKTIIVEGPKGMRAISEITLQILEVCGVKDEIKIKSSDDINYKISIKKGIEVIQIEVKNVHLNKDVRDFLITLQANLHERSEN